MKRKKERRKIAPKKTPEGFPTVGLCKLCNFFFPSWLLNGSEDLVIFLAVRNPELGHSRQRPSTTGSLW